ncbi:fatty-acid-binding protein 2 [Salvia miltiorrhiza]|uniref:fatty-acid-binding protein 2 n=1 Tax=Salvia miltiorrhiza TaxID=226208 RepID=UPI0025AB9170|nr:fatty-acid-binding protein 2 [Salvia miltiorrhiza]XP_057799905.1 fatty-acid-binding protein 2 [Salvia miltiorrhiza]XP_057799906.1 fatty-acid-binding protein 2 [Salvia miltiorrhiza]
MGTNWLFFVEPDGNAGGVFPIDPILPHSLGAHWISHIASLVDNSRHLLVPGSMALQEAFSCMSKFAGALVIWCARGSNANVRRKSPGGDHLGRLSSASTQVRHISSVRRDLTGFFCKLKCSRMSAIPVVFNKISSFALKQLSREAQWLQTFPMLSLGAALVPPLTNVSTNVLAMEAQRITDQKLCEIESRGCGPCNDLHLQSLAWAKTTEPRTGVEFPTMLDNSISGESNSGFTPEILVGTGSRIMTVIRIKSLKVYAFGFYVHPFDVCEKLGPKYACIAEHELNKCQDFYRDLLRADINMTVRLVVSCNGIKINTVKDVFEKSLRARLTKTNPEADFSCLQEFGSIFTQDITLRVGTTINFRRTAEGLLVTEVEGNNIGAVQSKDLCRAFFDMYIGEIPVCEQTKEEIGKNVASIIRMC